MPPGHAFSSAARNNFHLSYCSLNTHMAKACGHDSHVGGRMLDHSIRGPFTSSISPGLYGWTGQGGLLAIKDLEKFGA
jgi:hypothetical protein